MRPRAGADMADGRFAIGIDLGGTFVKSEVIRSPDLFIHYVYDPSNGTRSPGEIFLAGGSPTGATASVMRLARQLQ